MRVAISLRSARVISLSLSERVLYPAADRALPSLRRGVERACKGKLVHVRDYFPSKIASLLRVFTVFFQRNNRAITRCVTINYHELLADSRFIGEYRFR